VELPEAGCVIVGPNGHGKTSLLEAALYCEVFRSFRGAADRELVAFGREGFYVAADVSDTVDRSVACGFDARTRAKRITVGGVPVPRGGAPDAIGLVRGVVVSPGDVALVAGGPRERRRFLDVLLALTVPGYVGALSRYRRELAHRSRATGADLPAWERLLAERGAVLARARRAWAAAWRERYAVLCHALGEPEAGAELAYQPSVEGSGEEHGAAALAAALERHRARDVARGRTGVGPHRDRLQLLLGGRDLRAFGSAGQQRTAAIALRLCEAETLSAHAGAPVTVGLDDAFAELDADRSRRLAGLVERYAAAGSQVIAAVPKDSEVPAALGSLALRRIHEGRIA
jgi:DNA replication and repair protein RecF